MTPELAAALRRWREAYIAVNEGDAKKKTALMYEHYRMAVRALFALTENLPA